MKYVNQNPKFFEYFNPETGDYLRSGVIDENHIDTGIDPFMRDFPNLLDIGIMQKCVCSKSCKVGCYQKASERKGSNMSLMDYESIISQCEGKVFQVALGGAGDPDTHEEFESILKLTRKYNIVPNFTTSGIAFTKEKADLCKQYCGAVAVSEHNEDYTERALDLLIQAGVKTNIHYVLSKSTIDDAIYRLKTNGFHKGINAVVFLLYKPVGFGTQDNVLNCDDERVKEFFGLIDGNNFDFKIGFDSCSCAGVLNYTKKIDIRSMDFCEGARFSMYIDANSNAMPCSFGNQDSKWYVDLHTHTIAEAWNSGVFNHFRYSLNHSCSSCDMRDLCGGGCPIVNEITLCNRKEKDFKRGN